jgi:hypothetical protein
MISPNAVKAKTRLHTPASRRSSNELDSVNTRVREFIVFWDVTPYNLVKRYQRFKGRCFFRDSTLNMKIPGSSEKLVSFYQTTRSHPR